MKKFKTILLFSALLSLISCSKKGPIFVVEGKITDANSDVLYLEKRDLNSTSIVDSIKLTSNGDFKFEGTSTLYPEFYILRLNGQIINLAIDSTETLMLNASKKDFAKTYNVKGSPANEQLKIITLAQYKAKDELKSLQEKFKNKEVDEAQYIQQVNLIATEYKNTAKKIIFADLKSPASYFALFQKVDDLLFFDPYDRLDYQPFAAVATSWDANYPTSPRTEQLKNFTLKALKVRKQNQPLSIDPNSISEITPDQYYTIELPDINNKMIQLSSLKNKVVLLDFTLYQAEESPLHNIALNKIYTKFKDKLEIYQVGFDSDSHFWRNAAVNIPWIAVHDEQSINSPLLMKFNIQQLPSMFLVNKEGEVAKRILPTDNIESEIQKLL